MLAAHGYAEGNKKAVLIGAPAGIFGLGLLGWNTGKSTYAYYHKKDDKSLKNILLGTGSLLLLAYLGFAIIPQILKTSK